MKHTIKLFLAVVIGMACSLNSHAASMTIDDVPDTLFVSEFRADANLTGIIELYNGDSDTLWLENFALIRKSNKDAVQSTLNFPEGAFLEPGECYLIQSSNLWHPEALVNAGDTIHNVVNALRNGTSYVNLCYINVPEGEDPVVVDQVLTAQGHQGVAGVANATKTCFIIRKFSVKRGNPDFGTSASNEWLTMDLPNNAPWRDGIGFTSIYGNHGNYQISITPEPTVSIDHPGATITVPYGYWRQDYFIEALNPGPGMAWEYYIYNDTASILAQTGDKVAFFAFGNDVQTIEYDIVVLDPENTYANVAPYGEKAYSEEEDRYAFYFGNEEWPNLDGELAYYRYNVTEMTDGTMDTIGAIIPKRTNINNTTYEPKTIPFATRVDTLIKYINIPENCTYNMTWVDGVERIDLKLGDILNVVAEDGNTTHQYYLNVDNYVADENTVLISATWPDKPEGLSDIYYENQGWKGDTIPGFYPSVKTYYINLYPAAGMTVPALAFETETSMSTIKVDRAFDLYGSVDKRTTTVTVIAEDDSTTTDYKFIFKVASIAGEEPFIADPIFTQHTYRYNNVNSALEISNPGNQPLDLSNYMIVSQGVGTNTPESVISQKRDAGYYNTGHLGLYTKYIPGCKWDSAVAYVNAGINMPIDDNDAVNHNLPAGGSFLFMSTEFRATTNGSWSKFPEEVMSHPHLIELPSQYSENTNAWNEIGWNNHSGISRRNKGCIMLFEILNDSVKTGKKNAMDPSDFRLVDWMGPAQTEGKWIFENGSTNNPEGINIGANNVQNATTIIRKPNVYKGITNGVTKTTNPGFGSDSTECEWYWYGNQLDESYESYVPGVKDPIFYENLGKHSFDPVSVYQSVVGAKQAYIISAGFGKGQTIDGIVNGTTAKAFFANIDTLDAGQTMTLYSAGTVKTDMGYTLANADSLVVVSADGKNTTTYSISVTADGLDSNTGISSSSSEVTVDNSTVTVAKATTIEAIYNAITTESATSKMYIMLDDANVPTKVVGTDNQYISNIVVDGMTIEVIAQNGNVKIYNIEIDGAENDAYVMSNIYVVTENNMSVAGVPTDLSVANLLSNLYGSKGATVTIVDHLFFERAYGTVRLDDQIKVVSEDGAKTVYYQVTMVGETDPEGSSLEAVEDNENKFSIYPNPTDGIYYIEGDLTNSIITTFSINGSIINRMIQPSSNSVNLSQMESGVYIVVISNIEGGREIHKIIKK